MPKSDELIVLEEAGFDSTDQDYWRHQDLVAWAREVERRLEELEKKGGA